MNRRWQTLLGLGAGLLVAGCYVSSLVGCASSSPTASSRPTASQLKEGINVLDAKDPAFGLSAAYLQSGRVVYVETRVGALKPEVYRNDAPEEPANEMDMRFVDENNITFFAMRGGDNFVDASWGGDVQHAEGQIPVQGDRTLDFQLAAQAATALSLAAPSGFQDHLFHLKAFAAQPNPASDPAMLASRPKTAAVVDVQRPYSSTWSGTATIQTTKWSRPCVELTWFYAASHSATNMYANGGLVIEACNHGTCPGGSKMSNDCSVSGYNAVAIDGETSGSQTGNNDGTGGCQTAYSWDSGSGSHLCNDDAAYELFQAVHGTTDQSTFAIGNQGSHCRGSLCGSSPSNYACNCANGACSGDWNTPNCGSTNF